MKFFHPEVQRRISQSLGYFGSGLFIIGGLMGALRNSRLANMNPCGLLAITIFTVWSTQLTSYHTSKPLKHLLWMSYMSSIALSLVPLINMASMAIIFDAIFATGLTMGGLGLVAYNAPSQHFLQWGGMLGMGLACMTGVSLSQIFWPSPALFNIWLYGGLLLYGALTLYGIQKLIHAAKSKADWDPINESLYIYFIALSFFGRFFVIFMKEGWLHK
jgi:FtsH-binding integral membrane protein